MEIVLAIAIGVLGGSGVWLLLRPRTFQVIIGLSLLSYAVNLFILAMGRLRTGAPPILPVRGCWRSRAVRRPLAAGARLDGHRHQLRHHRALSGDTACFAWPVGHGSRRWPGARAMNELGDHLMIAPIVMPLLAGAAMLVLGGERSRNYQAAISWPRHLV